MRIFAVMLLAISLVAVTPVQARWKLIEGGAPVTMKKTGLTVTPPQDWNRDGSRPGKKARSWTRDGYSLNQITFFGNIEGGEMLYRDRNKKTQPLPKFSSSMLIPDIVTWFEANKRIVFGTALFEVSAVEPFQFAGHPGFRFKYNFVTSADELKKRGDAAGAVIDDKLYLINYVGADIHYFDKDHAQFEAILASAKLGS